MTPGADAGRVLVAGQSGAASVNELPSYWPNREASRVLVTGGRRWHVQELGTGAPLLLLHGTGASTHSWRGLMPRLADDFRVLAPDLPGHCRTERLHGERLSLEDMAGALEDLLDTVGFEPMFVVGHSAGAAIGLRMALDGRIAPVATVGLNAALLPYGGAWQPLISPLARLCASLRTVPRFLSGTARDPRSVRRMIENTGSDLDEDGLSLYQALLRSEDHVAAVLSMMANWDLAQFLVELPQLDGRLHLVTSDDDLAVKPAQAEKIKRLVPFADIVRVRGGHLAHEEFPGDFARLIARLCRSDGSRAG
jgi:magnesium chelatase accessory protein